jgi:two-component system, LytTR family, response regulator AgrA
MLAIIVCEDDLIQLQRMKQVIEKYIMIEEIDAQMVLATDDPQKVIDYSHNHPIQQRLYFLDVDLQHELTGITLASEIRKVDNLGKIVFITTQGSLSYLTFTYKVEALDYIIKERIEDTDQRIRESIVLAIHRYEMEDMNHKRHFKVTVGDTIRSIAYEDILFFESSHTPHKIILYTIDRELEFYGSVKDLENLEEGLFRCHKSFVVNINQIREVNKSERILFLEDGSKIPVAIRALKRLKELLV